MERHAEFYGRSIATHRVGAFDVSITEYAGGTTIAWHDHTGPYLTYVVRGRYCERLQKSQRDCGRSLLVPHSRGELHCDDFSAATRCVNIQPDAAWLTRWGISFDDCRPLSSTVSTSLVSRIGRELRGNDGLSSMVSEALLHELLAAFMRDQKDGAAPRWLRRIRDEVLSRFREPLTLRDFASAAQVHPAHLARSFRHHYGQTMGELIRERRIEYAKSRIQAGCDLREAALDAGFADQSHLTRTFRLLTGVTPAEFRRANRVPRR